MQISTDNANHLPANVVPVPHAACVVSAYMQVTTSAPSARPLRALLTKMPTPCTTTEMSATPKRDSGVLFDMSLVTL
jgi:hypothetical protein